MRQQSRSPRSRRFGFPDDWDVVILDSQGRQVYESIPTDVVTFGLDVELEDMFDEDEIRSEGIRTLLEDAGYSVVERDGFLFVGRDTASVYNAIGEWETRDSRLPPSEVEGMRLSQGSREGVAIVAFEGHPRPDMAAYVDALTGFNWRCDPSESYLYDGWFINLRSAADMDPAFLSEFAEGNLPDQPANGYDKEILSVVDGKGSASIRGRMGGLCERRAGGRAASSSLRTRGSSKARARKAPARSKGARR